MTPQEYRQLIKKEKKNKYGAIRVRVGDETFDSRKEYKRFNELQLMQKAGVIKNLVRQPKYLIEINDEKVCTVIPDFEYMDLKDGLVVEDTKSEATRKNRVYRLKKKLLRACWALEIKEV